MLANKTIKEKLNYMRKYNITYSVMLYPDIYCYRNKFSNYYTLYTTHTDKYWKYGNFINNFTNKKIFEESNVELMLINRYNSFINMKVYSSKHNNSRLNIGELYNSLKTEKYLQWKYNEINMDIEIISKLIDNKLYEEYSFTSDKDKIMDIINKLIIMNIIDITSSKNLLILNKLLSYYLHYDIISVILKYLSIYIEE